MRACVYTGARGRHRIDKGRTRPPARPLAHPGMPCSPRPAPPPRSPWQVSRHMHATFQALNSGHPGARASAATLLPPPSVRQSATVLMGSPDKSAAEGGGGGWDAVYADAGGGWARGAGTMSSKRWGRRARVRVHRAAGRREAGCAWGMARRGERGGGALAGAWCAHTHMQPRASLLLPPRYQDLSRQVDARVAAYKAQPKHRRQDVREVEARLQVRPAGGLAAATAAAAAAATAHTRLPPLATVRACCWSTSAARLSARPRWRRGSSSWRWAWCWRGSWRAPCRSARWPTRSRTTSRARRAARSDGCVREGAGGGVAGGAHACPRSGRRCCLPSALPVTHAHAMPCVRTQERAMQCHALALADERVGSNWWRHLRALNRADLQEALLQEDEERWKVRWGVGGAQGRLQCMARGSAVRVRSGCARRVCCTHRAGVRAYVRACACGHHRAGPHTPLPLAALSRLRTPRRPSARRPWMACGGGGGSAPRPPRRPGLTRWRG